MIVFLVLIAASILGGAANALAGGGTFLTFPALLLGGIAPVRANATASLVLLPGSFASAWVYRDTIDAKVSPEVFVVDAGRQPARVARGQLLLMFTSNATFRSLVPWLLLAATAVFSAAPWVRQWARRSAHRRSES